MSEEQQGNIIIYQSEDGNTKIDVHLENENIWLSQQQMAELYQSSRTNVVEHITHIYEEGELEKDSTCRKFRQVRLDGNQEGKRQKNSTCKDFLQVRRDNSRENVGYDFGCTHIRSRQIEEDSVVRKFRTTAYKTSKTKRRKNHE